MTGLAGRRGVTISTGMFGTKESFAPLYSSRTDGDGLQLAVTKDIVKAAPGVDAGSHIGESENDALYQYYAGYLGDGQHQDHSAGQWKFTTADLEDLLTRIEQHEQKRTRPLSACSANRSLSTRRTYAADQQGRQGFATR